jgi:hypothetical protein
MLAEGGAMSMTDSPPCFDAVPAVPIMASGRVIRFPGRRASAVFVSRAREGGWLVTAGAHGWLHGDRARALADARWLAALCGFRIDDGGGE